MESMEYQSSEVVWKVQEAQWGEGLESRTFQYALRIMRLYRHLCKQQDHVARILGKQLVRSGTSIGAMVAESRSAESRADYAHKLSVALKEARESQYWIRLLIEDETISKTKLDGLLDETDQLVAVLTSITIKLKRKQP